MILFLTLLYVGILLILVKFKVLKWTLWTKLSPAFVMVGLLIFLVFPLQFAAPQGEIIVFRYSVPIVARVGGEVIEVPVVPNVPLKKGDVLFKIDPVPYQAAVDALKAQLELARTRSEQSAKLAAAAAGSVYEKQMYATQVLQIEAQLKNAQYNLDATVVCAPANGYVTNVALRPGARVAAMPLSPAMSFIDTSEMVVGMQIYQSFSRHVEVGQDVEIAFKVRPGNVAQAKVETIIQAVATGQVAPGGTVQMPGQRIPGVQFLRLKLKDEEFAKSLMTGAMGEATIYTESLGAFQVIRRVEIRMTSWLDYINPF